MFKFLRKSKSLISKKEKTKDVFEGFKLTKDMNENVGNFKAILGDSNDVIVHIFSCGQTKDKNAALIYIDGLADKKIVNDNIIKPLLYDSKFSVFENSKKIKNLDVFSKLLISAGDVKETGDTKDLLNGFLSGDTVLLVDGFDKGLIISTRGWDMRTVAEPAAESVVRGPREGFNENMRTTTALIRRKIKDPALKFEAMQIGERTRTNVIIAYIKGIANEELLKEVKDRLDKIETDAILESGYIEQYIEDEHLTVFPTLGYTEKPDVVAAKILEGRVAIIVDGTPFVLTAPFIFIENFQSAEDYYVRPFYGTLLRFLRFTAYAISMLAPAIYVALTAYHQELIPTPLLFTMAKAMEGTPFPSAVEAIVMLLTFEILREGGVRLPRPVGQAISIVGALVMGQAAVSAGIIGSPIVIVVAITAVSSFVSPSLSEAGTTLRFVLLILASIMGGYGITMGLLFVLIHLASLESFKTPYLSPLAPLRPSDTKDAIIRGPLYKMINRPLGMAKQNPIRQEKTLKASKSIFKK